MSENMKPQIGHVYEIKSTMYSGKVLVIDVNDNDATILTCPTPTRRTKSYDDLWKFTLNNVEYYIKNDVKRINVSDIKSESGVLYESNDESSRYQILDYIFRMTYGMSVPLSPITEQSQQTQQPPQVSTDNSQLVKMLKMEAEYARKKYLEMKDELDKLKKSKQTTNETKPNQEYDYDINRAITISEQMEAFGKKETMRMHGWLDDGEIRRAYQVIVDFCGGADEHTKKIFKEVL